MIIFRQFIYTQLLLGIIESRPTRVIDNTESHHLSVPHGFNNSFRCHVPKISNQFKGPSRTSMSALPLASYHLHHLPVRQQVPIMQVEDFLSLDAAEARPGESDSEEEVGELFESCPVTDLH